MTRFVRERTVLVVLVGALLAALLGAVAWAAPGGPGGGGSSGEDATAVATGTPQATETPEARETPEATEIEDAETPESETPEANETEEPEDADDGLGVPLDSPACAGDLEHLNPHDTDGDGDGCREVETDDGLKNLPDPAADAHEGNPGHIGDLHGNGNDGGNNGNSPPDHARTPGPPEGDPPYGHANGQDD